jgi:preprotein translocase subunit SecF
MKRLISRWNTEEVRNLKKWLILWSFLVLVLGAASLAYAGQSGTESKKANITGVYTVTFTTDQGQQQSAQIRLEDLKNGQVEASGDYKGYPVSIVGDLTGDVTKGGAVCSFNINKPGLITGRAEITIQLAEGQYQLQGQFEGSYSYLGNSGKTSGGVKGNRLESAATSNSSSLRTAASIAGLACLIAGLIYVIWRRRAKKVRS